MRNAPLFYLVFILLYGAMHLLVFSHACHALRLRDTSRTMLALFFLAMTLAPVVAGLLGDRTGPMSCIAFVWMGLVFYLFLGTLPLALTRSFTPQAVQQALFLTLVLACIGVSAYGVRHARTVEVRRVTVTTDKLPPGTDRVRVAVLSDLHLYSVEEGARLDRVLPVLQSLDYDLLVSLGDLIEMGVHNVDWRESSARLSRVTPRLGKYAVNGNHDRYADRVAGYDISAAFHKDAGFRLLRGEAADVGGILWLAGVDYPLDKSEIRRTQPTEADLLRGVPHGRPVILLKHLPLANPEERGLFDLQLSGHTHAGQIWPFSALVRLQFPYLEGLYDLAGGAKLYVNPGTGTWGPPMRVGTTAEITLVTLERATSKTAGR